MLLVWGAFLVWGVRLTDAGWARIIPGFEQAEGVLGPTPPGRIRVIVGLMLLLVTVLLALAAIAWRFQDKLEQPEIRTRLMGAAVATAVVCVLFDNLAERNFEPTWYRISDMMTHPETVKFFGHRLLMIWPAMLLKHFVPKLSYIQSFIVIQALGIVVAVYAIGEWSALFVGRELKFLGQILLAVLFVPTAAFYSGHDIAVVFTYAFCFLFLYKRQYVPFLIVFCIGIFNHENVVFLIPTAIAVMWRVEEIKTIAWVAAAAAIAYYAAQYVLNQYIPPFPATREFRVWWNVRLAAEGYRTMVFAAMLMAPWYLGAAVAFKRADPFLKRASILAPIQFVLSFLLGQLNEPRLFDDCLPILIGIYLCYIRERFGVKTAAALAR